MSCRGSPASSRAPQFHRALRRDNGQVVQPFMRVGTYPTRDFATLGMLLLVGITDRCLLSLGERIKVRADPHPNLPPARGKGLYEPPTGPVISAGLYMSPCRSDHIFPLVPTGVWRMVSEDSREVRASQWTWVGVSSPRSFLLIVRTGRIITGRPRLDRLGSAGYSEFPAYSQILQRP